jgi:transcriptional regulator with XRE-family HTH domain
LACPKKEQKMETLKNKMSERGLTYRELAARTNLSAQTVWNIANDVNSPTLNSLRELARGLGVTVEELIEDTKTR